MKKREAARFQCDTCVCESACVCVNGQHLPLSTFLHALFTWAFLATLRRSTSASTHAQRRQRQRLHLLSACFSFFAFCCCFFSLIFNASQHPLHIACGCNSLPRSLPIPLPASSPQLWHVACFTFALFLLFFSFFVANFNCLETSCGPAENLIKQQKCSCCQGPRTDFWDVPAPQAEAAALSLSLRSLCTLCLSGNTCPLEIDIEMRVRERSLPLSLLSACCLAHIFVGLTNA